MSQRFRSNAADAIKAVEAPAARYRSESDESRRVRSAMPRAWLLMTRAALKQSRGVRFELLASRATSSHNDEIATDAGSASKLRRSASTSAAAMAMSSILASPDAADGASMAHAAMTSPGGGAAARSQERTTSADGSQDRRRLNSTANSASDSPNCALVAATLPHARPTTSGLYFARLVRSTSLLTSGGPLGFFVRVGLSRSAVQVDYQRPEVGIVSFDATDSLLKVAKFVLGGG